MGKYKKRADGRYYTRVPLGVSPDGTYRYKYIYGKTLREVDEALDAFKQEQAAGLPPDRKKCTFAEMAAFWLEKGEIQASEHVRRIYARRIKKHLNPAFGGSQIINLRKTDLRALLSRLAAEAMAKSTLHKIKGTASAVMELACDEGFIAHNPFRTLKVPGKKSEERQPISQEQSAFLLSRWEESSMGLPAMIMLLCGLRRGEVLALKWEDIHDGYIFVSRAVFYPKGSKAYIKEPKSEAGIRKVPLPAILQEILARCTQRSVYVCPSRAGGLMGQWAFYRAWERFMEEFEAAGFPSFTPHQLRHTYATMLYSAGVDILTAQRLLGHASPQVTLEIYTHLEKQKKQVSIQAFEEHIKNVLCQNCVMS